MAPKQIKSKVALHKVFQRRVGERCLSLGAKLLNMHVLRRTQIKHGGLLKYPRKPLRKYLKFLGNPLGDASPSTSSSFSQCFKYRKLLSPICRRFMYLFKFIL